MKVLQLKQAIRNLDKREMASNNIGWLDTGYSIQSYISSCLSVLHSWSWIYKERMTDILKAEILDKPPASTVLPFLMDLQIEELKEVPHGFVKDEWPNELKDFINKCGNLKLNIIQEEYPVPNIDSSLLMKMKAKKREEVSQLSAMVVKECSQHNIHHVVDIGSGLGYVDRVLHEAYGLKVLGLEKDVEKVKKAREIGGGVNYEEAFLSEETFHVIKKVISDWLQGSSACFIALHACGDLSALAGKLFASMDEGKCLIIIPCCYHLSNCRPLCEEVKHSNAVNINLLRLASDATSERWKQNCDEELMSHARSVLARALVERLASEGCTLVKKKYRHLLRSDARSDWNKCLESCLERFSGLDRDKVALAWTSNEWRIDQVKAFSCLQTCLQGVAEGLVLADTFLFFSTLLSFDSRIRLIRIFDILKSPRSISFVINR